MGGPSEIKSSEEEEEEEEGEDYCVMASTDEDESSASEEEEVRVVGKNKKKGTYVKTKEEDRARRSTQLRATLIGDEFQSENPFFTIAYNLLEKILNLLVIVQPIPASFNEKFMFRHGKKSKPKGRLTIGVALFLKDNDLVVGDVILVELMKEMKYIYLDAKVHIFRA
ncbi:hypothetical protein MKX01_005484 [Papaver californicum]|nr:hypothetical protein MKX01_005484 [Papaver californicum]